MHRRGDWPVALLSVAQAECFASTSIRICWSIFRVSYAHLERSSLTHPMGRCYTLIRIHYLVQGLRGIKKSNPRANFLKVHHVIWAELDRAVG